MPQSWRQRPSLRPPAVRFQDGGQVPGTGRGDKIPAKYELGEFVVSNDMIDDNPGLDSYATQPMQFVVMKRF